jgi:MoxR-like ATPase
MTYPFIKKDRIKPIPAKQLNLPPFQREFENHPKDYDTDTGLENAVNVALLMGQPLLLTGPSGCGKTQVAYRVAWELGLEPVLLYATKSTSTSKDLFYSYDYFARFHAAQDGKDVSPERFITYHALGEALIRANPKDQIKQFLPPGFQHESPQRSVVLIDEIDKAPRNFPNDILNEIENLYFRVPELGTDDEIRSDHSLAPLIFITSNAEKTLPRPFLRRCAYYHISFPDPKRMKRILMQKLQRIPSYMGRKESPDDQFITNAVDLFFDIRSRIPEENKPSTSELIRWVTAMREMSGHSDPITQDPNSVISAMNVLLKSKSEKEAALKLYGNGKWKPSR